MRILVDSGILVRLVEPADPLYRIVNCAVAPLLSQGEGVDHFATELRRILERLHPTKTRARWTRFVDC